MSCVFYQFPNSFGWFNDSRVFNLGDLRHFYLFYTSRFGSCFRVDDLLPSLLFELEPPIKKSKVLLTAVRNLFLGPQLTVFYFLESFDFFQVYSLDFTALSEVALYEDNHLVESD